ncbi:uncharacterized protein JN550_007934 [Neoarthrinium moseri]|uniref:uncharacterized protein n=1 Tax=Neoarthrinium moseri TaxID=1658444 RepID=UPI001FDB10D1|nr:uncharacterized protein JN550_007934 [Neoarthrinium moseri]KAI1865956.1 hypothetical protein JN550_007934 [Neoarthrinium moseri]
MAGLPPRFKTLEIGLYTQGSKAWVGKAKEKKGSWVERWKKAQLQMLLDEMGYRRSQARKVIRGLRRQKEQEKEDKTEVEALDDWVYLLPTVKTVERRPILKTSTPRQSTSARVSFADDEAVETK